MHSENYLVTLHVTFNISQNGWTHKVAILKVRNLHVPKHLGSSLSSVGR
jgi:hypothetical protein